MNYRQLQYAVLLSKEGNFSQLAEKLGITQPALSKQILSLEKELGVELFNRNSTPVTPTKAGEFLIKEAEELIFREDRLLKAMEQFKSGEDAILDIGITPFRSSYLAPKAVKALREAFPNVTVRLHEEGSEALRQDMAEGKFDFAVVNLPVDESVFDVTPMEPDRLALIVPDCIMEKHTELKGLREVDFSVCKDLPFAVVSSQQEMRRLFEALCRESGFSPNIAAEVVGLTTAWEMACSGVAATVLPLQFVKVESGDKKISVMGIKNTSFLRRPAVVTRRSQYISKYAKKAIELLCERGGDRP